MMGVYGVKPLADGSSALRQLAAVPAARRCAGGKVGYDKVEWQAAPEASDRGQAVRLTYTSLDGEEVSAAAPPLSACARLHAALPRPAAPFPADEAAFCGRKGCFLHTGLCCPCSTAAAATHDPVTSCARPHIPRHYVRRASPAPCIYLWCTP